MQSSSLPPRISPCLKLGRLQDLTTLFAIPGETISRAPCSESRCEDRSLQRRLYVAIFSLVFLFVVKGRELRGNFNLPVRFPVSSPCTPRTSLHAGLPSAYAPRGLSRCGNFRGGSHPAQSFRSARSVGRLPSGTVLPCRSA